MAVATAATEPLVESQQWHGGSDMVVVMVAVAVGEGGGSLCFAVGGGGIAG